jgi:hypothetical protein
MLNSSTLTGRQTQTRSRRVVGDNLMPLLVRLAECADDDLAHSARAVVLSLYGGKLPSATRERLAQLSADDLETMLDVMAVRAIEPSEVPQYLVLYLGPSLQTSCSDTAMSGFACLALQRDGEVGNRGGSVAAHILLLDLLGRLLPAVRDGIRSGSSATLRGLCDELAEHDDVPDPILTKLLEASL